jgi:hypothetical protein
MRITDSYARDTSRPCIGSYGPRYSVTAGEATKNRLRNVPVSSSITKL